MAKLYYDSDADLNALKGKTLAVLGYGSQGRAQAQNLHDSGVNVVVGARKGGKSWKQATADGLKVASVEEACKQAQIIMVLIPDDQQVEVYTRDILPNLTKGKALYFSHGFNVHYYQVVPPDDVDVIMIAPKSPGDLVRRMYRDGKGVPGLLAVYRDATGKAKQTALAIARGIGCTKAGVIETTFKEETETDLFGEQCDLCGGVTSMIKTSFNMMVEYGYQPEVAYFEALNELKLIVDLIFERGITGLWRNVSDIAQYGGLTRGPELWDDHVKETMHDIMRRIQNGEFAREWVLENTANRAVFKTLTRQDEESLLEQVGAELRAMMPWTQEGAKK